MAQDKSLFERLDNISSNQSDILNAISGVDEKVSSTDARLANIEKRLNNLQSNNISRQTYPSEPPVKTFARNAKKSWRWFGNKKEFKRAKTIVVLFSLAVLIMCIVSTIITSISIGGYSPFTSIENIWLIFAIIYFVFACKAPINYEVNAFASNTPYRFERDDIGMVFPVGGEKRVFKIFRVIVLVFIVFNIIWIWMHQSNISWLATIVEVLFALLIIAASFINLLLYPHYCICWLEGKNLSTGQKVILLKMPGAKNFLVEKEAREFAPELFE